MPEAAGRHEGVRPHVEPDGGLRRRGCAAAGVPVKINRPLALREVVGVDRLARRVAALDGVERDPELRVLAAARGELHLALELREGAVAAERVALAVPR